VARALAVRPDMLLLDEAFSALDRNLREDMQLELSLLLRRLKVTTVLVTHDQREAFALADRIAIMERGRIAQIGTPEDVYRKPGSSSVLRFLGTTNRFTGDLSDSGEVSILPGLSFAASVRTGTGAVLVDIRAEDIAVSREPTAQHRTAPAQVVLRTFLGSQERIVLRLDHYQVVVDRPAQVALQREPLAIGQHVYLAFDPASCRLSATG
jgi:ABC-type Fe3+/spermidine/putrescine transport system ATPase subunit